MKALKMMSVMAALMMLAPAFVSCDTKEKDEPEIGQEISIDKIIDIYPGWLSYNVMGFEPGEIEGIYELRITKDATANDKVVVELPACTFTPPIPNSSAFTIPALTVSGVDVSVKDKVYTISKDDFSIDMQGTVYTGKLFGILSGNDTKVEYTVRPGRMPMDINFTFTSNYSYSSIAK